MDRETNKEVVNVVSDKPTTFTITRRISNNLVIVLFEEKHKRDMFVGGLVLNWA